MNPQESGRGCPTRLHHKSLTTGLLELKFHMYNLEVACNPKMLSLIGWKHIQCCYLPFKMADQVSTSGYKSHNVGTFY